MKRAAKAIAIWIGVCWAAWVVMALIIQIVHGGPIYAPQLALAGPFAASVNQHLRVRRRLRTAEAG